MKRKEKSISDRASNMPEALWLAEEAWRVPGVERSLGKSLWLGLRVCREHNRRIGGQQRPGYARAHQALGRFGAFILEECGAIDRAVT